MKTIIQIRNEGTRLLKEFNNFIEEFDQKLLKICNIYWIAQNPDKLDFYDDYKERYVGIRTPIDEIREWSNDNKKGLYPITVELPWWPSGDSYENDTEYISIPERYLLIDFDQAIEELKVLAEENFDKYLQKEKDKLEAKEQRQKEKELKMYNELKAKYEDK